MKAPGPPCLPLIGHIPQFRKDVLGLLTRAVRDYGDFVRFQLGPQPVYLINHPDAIAHVLRKNAGNYDKNTRSTRFLKDICGESLLTTNDAEWERRRRHFQPAFHRQALQGFESIMRGEAADLAAEWGGRAEVDASADLATTTFRIVARALFGAEISRETLAGLAAPITRVLSEAFTRVGSLTGWKSRAFSAAMRQLDVAVDAIIASRAGTPASPDLFELIRSGARHPKDIRDESIAFLLAGHETTANALTWLFAHLSLHPAEQTRCARDPDALARAFQESLRLSPPIWIIERRAIEEDVVAGFTIPKNASVVICPYTVHRHPDFWEAPEEFRPDRFLNPAPPAYLPFGLGARFCIGREFALMEARFIATAILENLVLLPVSPALPDPDPAITLRPKNGLPLALQKRFNPAS